MAVATLWARIPPAHMLYSGDCGDRAIYRNIYPQHTTDVASDAGYFFTAHHHQLRCTRLITQEQQSFIEAIIYGLGGGLGFALVIILFAALRERLQAADVPLPFRGSAIALITAGFMALAFMGFAGLAGS